MVTTLAPHQPLASEQERLELFQSLTLSQQRVLLGSTAQDTVPVAATRAGLSERTIEAWKDISNPQYSKAFTALWRERQVDTIGYMESLAQALGPANLHRIAGIAGLAASPEAWLRLNERTQGHVYRAVRDLVMLPLERHDKRKQEQQTDALVEIIGLLASKPRQVSGVRYEVLTQETPRTPDTAATDTKDDG